MAKIIGVADPTKKMWFVTCDCPDFVKRGHRIQEHGEFVKRRERADTVVVVDSHIDERGVAHIKTRTIDKARFEKPEYEVLLSYGHGEVMTYICKHGIAALCFRLKEVYGRRFVNLIWGGDRAELLRDVYSARWDKEAPVALGQVNADIWALGWGGLDGEIC